MSEPAKADSQGLDELFREVEKRVHIAMIHARNTKEAPSIQPMLVDTVKLILEAIQAYAQNLSDERVRDARITERLHFANQMLGNDEWNIPSEVPDRPLLTDRLLEVLEDEVATLTRGDSNE